MDGGYLERGDTGRWAVELGDVVIHKPFEAHSNVVRASGARVVNIDLPSASDLPAVFRLAEQDMLIKQVNAGAKDAFALLVPQSTSAPLVADWPDLLAADVRQGPVSLRAWSASAG